MTSRAESRQECVNPYHCEQPAVNGAHFTENGGAVRSAGNVEAEIGTPVGLGSACLAHPAKGMCPGEALGVPHIRSVIHSRRMTPVSTGRAFVLAETPGALCTVSRPREFGAIESG